MASTDHYSGMHLPRVISEGLIWLFLSEQLLPARLQPFQSRTNAVNSFLLSETAIELLLHIVVHIVHNIIQKMHCSHQKVIQLQETAVQESILSTIYDCILW